MRKWLVSLDTDRIKDYVFTTGRLREIRGATTILDRLNHWETRQLLGAGELVFAGGGSAMAEFDDKKEADRFLREVEASYPQQSGGATITGVVVEFDDDVSAESPDSFRNAVRKAAHQLQKAKLAGKPPAHLLAHALWRRCERCGQYPVTQRQQAPNNAFLELCERCATQRAESFATEESNLPSYKPEQRLITAAGGQWPSSARFPSELDDLGNYVGLVYADGNDVGRVVEEQMTDPSNLRAFSEVLENAALAALVTATRPYWKAGPEALPFLPIVLGGDDLLIIAAGAMAFPIAATLSRRFQEEVRARSKSRKKKGEMSFEGEALEVAMSVGIAVAHTSYPLFALEELTEQLLRSAKRLSRLLEQKGFGQVGTLDFRVISTSSANPWDEVRQQEYHLPTPAGQLEQWGTARPYPVQSVDGLARPSWNDLEQAALRLKQSHFPRNKLNAWRELLWVEPALQAQLNLSTMLTRLAPEQEQGMRDAVRGLGLSDITHFFFTDPVNLNHRLSPLPDLVEVYDFIREAR